MVFVEILQGDTVMSGPKLSVAEIERRRQEQLERERQELLRKLREAQRTYRQACDKIEDTKRYALSLLTQIDDMYKGDARKAIDNVLVTLNMKLVVDDKDIQSYLAAANAMEKDIKKVISDVDKSLGVFLTQDKTNQKLSKSNSIHQSFQAYISLSSDPVNVLTIDFKNNYDRKQLLNKINQILIHYKWMRIHGKTDLIRQYAAKAEENIQNIITNNGLKYSDIVSQLQSIINEEVDVVRRETETAALYDNYVAIATLMNISPKKPSDFFDAKAIKKDISDLNCKLRKKDEMDYIADQINDAMISLGYGLVTSMVLTRKDQSEMDCSLYQADDETGIAIYTDQTGAVMMRMTVLGDDTDITEDDRDFSLQRQIDFCAGHADIVDALAERGVYLKQKSYLEPDKKHTYKVNMNSTGSTVQKDANGQTILKKDKIDRRKRRRANRKKVRAM